MTLHNCEIIKVTEESVLIDYEGARVWFPLWQIEEGVDITWEDEGDVMHLNVPEWLAFEKRLI